MNKKQAPVRAPSTQHHSIRLNVGDEQMIAFISQTLGCGKAEAIRTAIRVYAGLLTQQQSRK